jgi:hypothetical protein
VGSGAEVIKRRKYGIRKLDFIRQALAGYAGGSAIISEMLQNADDAAASKAMFQFRTQDFLAWNNSIFSDQDWENLTSIASGGKRDEEGKIGTWGTGFLSVFHLTDIPEVNSAGEKLILDPREEFADVISSNINDGTGFRLEWRRKPSEISREIEADIWSDENIRVLKDDLAVSIYRQIIFLRNVNCIEVYEGDRWQEKLLYRVMRTRKSIVQQNEYRCELWDIDYQRAGVQPRLDSWLYYRGNVPKHLMVEGVKPKDTEIGIAFPVENREWLAKNLPGTLYNFLPTPISTGYNFHINGAFFPDNNRRTILIDLQTQREKSRWNLNVIDAIGDLFVEVLPDIRDRLVEPRRFYEILPTQPPLPAQDFLKPVYECFCEAAPREKIVYSSQGEWSEPGKVAIGRPGSRLPELVADYLPIVTSGVPQTFRDFLISTLKIPFLEWKDAIAALNGHLRPGISLVEAHSMINSADKLWLLYSELPVNPTDEQRRLFADVALCLGEDGKLWPFSGDIWRASEKTRFLCSDTGLLFVSLEAQKQFSRLFENLVGELRGSELIEWLSKQPWPDVPINLSKIPALLESLDHVTELIDFFYADLQRIKRDQLKRLPIIYSEDGFLYTAEARIFFHRDAAERADLQLFSLHFVHPDWAVQEKIRAIYERAGIVDLTPRNLIQALQEQPLNTNELSHDELIEKLLKIYGYFNRNRGALDDVSKNALLTMPLCLTQRNRLTSIREEQNGLHLPGDERIVRSPALRSLDKLQLDHLIHSDVLAGRGFLSQVLGLRPLSEVDLIRDVVLKHYHDNKLDDTDRRNLLSYISEQMRSLPGYQQNELWPELRKADLILCSNGEYRPAYEVYFPAPTLDTVFVSGYQKLHPDYGVPVPDSDDEDQVPYRQSIWYWMFEHLHVNEAPAPSDLLETIMQLAAVHPPTEEQIDKGRRLYEFLNREITNNKTYANSLEIKQLADVAWLPARNNSDRWYRPEEIFQASLSYLIGDQAPLMRYGESSRDLRNVLGMPGYPQVDIVARHLIARAKEGKPLDDLRIYDDLGNRWSDIPYARQQELSNLSTIWSDQTNRYWIPGHVFLANYSHLFGRRRLYLQPPGGNAQKFLVNIGVREEPHPYKDSLDILNEIAGFYEGEKPIDDEDKKLIFVNLESLSRCEYHVYEKLVAINFLPANDRLLYAAAQVALVDRKDLLAKFKDKAFPYIDINELPEQIYRVLRKLGTPLLSELVRRKKVVVENAKSDTQLTYQISLLEAPLKRVARKFFADDDVSERKTFEKIANLVSFSIFACDRIEVEYFIQNGSGWDIVGYRDNSEKSLVDELENSLFVRRVSGALDNVQLALEITALLFPQNAASIIVERLLEKKAGEIDAYLDQHGYPKLMMAESTTESKETLVDTDAWKIPETKNPLEEEEREKLSADKESDDDNHPELDIDEPDDGGDYGESPTSLKSADEIEQPTETVLPEPEIEEHESLAPVPPFTGKIRPSTPVLPNDFSELRRRFGLSLSSAEQDNAENILNLDRIDADTEWEKDEDKDQGRVTSTRFTLTFSNRYEGFLPLHQSAKQMLRDLPPHLICETDFLQWKFILYVDYERQIIYNQRELPSFFEAHNIPAGA